MKIPPQAHLVFEGTIFNVYQWEQEMFDGSKATFEMLKRPNTLEVIAVQGDKIMVEYQQQPMKGPFYSLIGGRQEASEDPLSGAKRELLEESGLSANDWELLYQFEPYTKMEWTVYVYVARNCSRAAEPNLDPGEKITLQAVTFAEFINLVLSTDFYGREFQRKVMRMKFIENNLSALEAKIK